VDPQSKMARWFCVVASLLVLTTGFVVDVLTPPGVAAGMLYVFAVLLSLGHGSRSTTYSVAAAATLLALCEIAIAPAHSAAWTVIPNRGLAIMVIWAGAILVARQKAARRSLAESETRFRQMAENINEVFWLLSPDEKRHLYVSPAFERIWGWPREVLYSDPRAWRAAIHPEDREAVEATHDAAPADEACDLEYRIVRPDGTIRWIRDRSFPVRDEKGAVYRYAGIAEDVTDHRARVEALRESEERQLFALAAARMGWWDWDIRANRTRRCTLVAVICGLPSLDAIENYEQFLAIVHPDDRDAVDSAVRAAVENDSPYSPEFRIIRPDGSVRWVAERGRVERDASGAAVRMAGVILDITEQKAAAEALRESEERYRMLVQNVPDHIATIDRCGTIEYINHAADGWDREELIGRPVVELTAPELRDELRRCLAGVFDDGEPREWEGRDVYGRAYANRFVPISENGRVCRVLGIATDVTTRKHYEEAQEATNRLLRSTLDSLSAHVAILSETGAILEVNAAWRRFGETNVSSLPGVGASNNYFDACRAVVLDNDDDARAVVEGIDLLRRGEMTELCHEYECGTPTCTKWFMVRVTPFAGAGPARFVVSHEDITDRKRGEALASRRLRELAHAARLDTLGQMSSALAHELSQPLAAIANYAAGCRRRLERADCGGDLREAIDGIADQAGRAGAIIKHLRHFMRPGDAKRATEDINAVILELARLLHADARFHGIALRRQLCTSPLPVRADAVQLQQVIVNLVHNAIEAMQAAGTDGGEVAVRTFRSENEAIEVVVEDNGPGLAPERLDAVFAPFSSTKSEGLGLGLAICRAIVDAHDGRLWATSRAGGGCAFHFRLPPADGATVYE